MPVKPTLAVVAKKVHCSTGTLRRLIADGHLKARTVPLRRGKLGWVIDTELAAVQAAVQAHAPRSGYHKRVNGAPRPAAATGSLLASLVAWHAVGEAKRALLLQLAGTCTEAELTLLRDLVQE